MCTRLYCPLHILCTGCACQLIIKENDDDDDDDWWCRHLRCHNKRQSSPYSTKRAYRRMLIFLSYRTWARIGAEPLMSVTRAWPVRRQTYGYLPSRKASPPIGWYQIILLGDIGTCVLTTCPWLHSIAERLGIEPATYWSQVQRPNHSATEATRCHNEVK